MIVRASDANAATRTQFDGPIVSQARCHSSCTPIGASFRWRSDGDVHGDEFGHELLARDGDRQPSPCRPTTAAMGITQLACLPSSLPRKHVPP